jgi:hypothetical protein
MTPRLLLVVALLAVSAGVAQAQSPGGTSSGPLVFEPIENHFIVVPEYKYTDVDGRAGHMVGVNAGMLNDRALYLGGAVYFLTNGNDSFGLTYGGMLTGVTMPVGSHVRVGGGALLGFGSGKVDQSYVAYDPWYHAPRTYRYIVHSDFLLAEPQAQAHFSFADHVGANVSLGYRFAGYDEYVHDHGVDGMTAAVGAQLAW